MLVLLIAGPADACKYSVRDVAFVTMKDADYELVLVPTKAMAESTQATFLRIVKESLPNVDANVVVSILDPDTSKHAPGLWLVGPKGRAASVTIPLREGAIDWDELPKSIAAIVDSPARRELAKRLPSEFATVVFLEGSDPDENRRAREAVEQVVGQVSKVIERGRLEKAAKAPPSVLAIPFGEREREKWLIWSLAVDDDSNRAAAAIVFGRFRRGAKLFVGDDLKAETLFSPLATLGFSCECDLDRDKIYGPALPHRWTSDDRKRTAAAAGFEPDDPLVRAEVNAILAKKPLIEAGELSLNFRDLLLGLKETPLDEGEAPPAPQPKVEAAPTATRPPDNPTTTSNESLKVVVGALAAILFMVAGWTLLGRRKTLDRESDKFGQD